jgi:A118 family predicted phage portal protein
MFQQIIQWIRERLQKMLNTNDMKRVTGSDIAINPLMVSALNLWSLIYQNKAPWLNVDVHSLNLGAAIASELARTVTIEMKAEVSGSPRADFVNEQIKPLLGSIRNNTEYAAAKGGLVFKPYVKGGAIVIDCIQADMLYPTAFDSNGNMTGAVFVDQRTIGGRYYTRLESHNLIGTNYEITNTAYMSSVQKELGGSVSLESVADWAELEPYAIIQNVDRPLFAYFKMPFANNIDSTSPLGVSIFSRAAQSGNGGKSLLQEADEIYTSLVWELKSGERAVYTDVQAFKKNPITGDPELPNKKLYRLLDIQSKLDQPGFFEDWTPTIREQNYINGLEAIYRLIEYQCGLAEGSLPRPAALQFATATEIKVTKQRTYATVTDTQKSLENSLNQLFYAMDVYVTIYNLAPNGTYTTAYDWDDSIVSDHDTQFVQDQQTVTLQAMPKWQFLVRNYGLDEVQAKQWVADAQNELTAVNFFGDPNASVGV